MINSLRNSAERARDVAGRRSVGDVAQDIVESTDAEPRHSDALRRQHFSAARFRHHFQHPVRQDSPFLHADQGIQSSLISI